MTQFYLHDYVISGASFAARVYLHRVPYYSA